MHSDCNEGNGKLLLVKRAIASASRHGIKIMQGRANPGTGSCAFEAPIYNVNDRKCFKETLSKPIQYYRSLWVSEGERLLFDSPFNPGYSKLEWKAGFNKLKKSDVYEIDFFGDMMLPAIACGIKKTILIFNTNTESLREPVTVINPTDFGVNTTSKFPIVLAYDVAHYESLHPVSTDDDEKCIHLANKIINGIYEYTYRDLEYLVDLKRNDISYKEKELKARNDLEKRIDNQSSCHYIEKVCIGKDQNKKSKDSVRNMNDEERRRYHRERYQLRKAKMKNEDIMNLRNMWKKCQQVSRKGKRERDEVQFKFRRSNEKRKERATKRQENEAQFKVKTAEEKRKERNLKKQENEGQFKAKISGEKKNNRTKKRQENEEQFKAEIAHQRKSLRTKKRHENEVKFKAERSEEKRRERAKLRQKDESKFKGRISDKIRSLRTKKRQENEVEFKAERAEEKKKGRDKKKQKDEVQYKAKAADEKRKARTKKKISNEDKFKSERATEKRKERTKKRQKDEVRFKAERRAEKSKERMKKRTDDEEAFKNERKEEKRKWKLNKNATEEGRRECFRASIRDGRIYPCISCHRVCFHNGVQSFTSEFEVDITSKYKSLLTLAIRKSEDLKVRESFFICLTCKNYITKGKIPPMSCRNNLELFDINGYPEFQLTELENSMIALNLIFQKVIKLPKSRWPAMKDKTINIPISEVDVVNTIESLPRTPTSAGIIPIDLKRKLNFKNSHMTQYVSVPKVLKALKTLKDLGNPYYQFIPICDEFKEKLKENDIEGFKFIYPEDGIALSDEVGQQTAESKDAITDKEELDEVDKEDEYYRQYDSVKKWQFDYNRSTCFNHDYPEIDYKEQDPNRLAIAPGEGKYPSNILHEKDWDIKSFPALLPDGKNSLHTERLVKLSEQEYFVQRLMNRDMRFACSPAFCFAATGYIELKQIEGRKGIAFRRGKRSKSLDGTNTYFLDDPVSVLDNVRNTPRYWQKMRYELNAKLENLGPFQYFFTLSCADMRYPENFTPFLQDQTIHYEEINFQEQVFIGKEREPLMDYLSRHASMQDFIKRNLLNATLTFHQRVKMFMKHIIMNKGSPLKIRYYSYKVEFALRGAAHIHGVLWLDWDNFSALKSDNSEDTKVNALISAFNKIKDDAILSPPDKEILSELADLSITCSLKDPRTIEIVKQVQIHNHTKACQKYSSKCRFSFPRFPSLRTIIVVPFNKLEGNKEEQTKKLNKSKNLLKKVLNSLEDKDAIEHIVNQEKETIDKYIEIQKTIFIVERLLGKSKKNILIDLDEDAFASINRFISYDEDTGSIFRDDLQNILLRLVELKEVLSQEVRNVERRRLEKLLITSGIEQEENKDIVEVYEEALAVTNYGYKINHKRDINECFVNNYNAEWIICWNSNMDLQLCLGYHVVIGYIGDYFTKDDSGTMPHILDALKKSGDQSLQNLLSIVANAFLTHRQIGESEAFFKILPNLQMKHSNIDTVFLHTGFKHNRSSFLIEITEEQAPYCKNIIHVENKEGLFTEKPSLIDKYERIDTTLNDHLTNLSLIQFAMKYTASNATVKDSDFESESLREGDSEWEITDEMNLIVSENFEFATERFTLPKFIKLTNLKPGEPSYMRKRTRQVIRLHKINRTKYPHEYYFSQLQLYYPFKSESDLKPDDYEKCKNLYDQVSAHNNMPKVYNVRSILMKNLESVEQGTERARDTMNSEIEDILDPNFAQEQTECELEGFTEDYDYLHKDPSELESTSERKQGFRSIELHDSDTLESLTSTLDANQRIVLDVAVNFARSAVKAKESKASMPSPELNVVQGGAGTGKITVIDVLSQHMEKIFRSPGDNPDHPYIVKAAFTGTAAANIKGQTLHSAFSFSFGNEFYSLGDKAREERRNQLENLQVVIIDEFSFIKSDMLYLLDLRLREIKQQSKIPFGGVSVFLFGDILQLRPVCASYIFEEPFSDKFKLAFNVDSLWKKFKFIVLTENHRQGEDRAYADLLNRARTGELIKEDIEKLEERVRPSNHPDIPHEALVITCTNKEVNRINEERLACINEAEVVSESINKGSNQKAFQPKTDPSGAVKGTPLQKTLKLKIGAKVMLTYNINTVDCLTNGAFGEVLGFEYNTMGGLKGVHVHFFNPDCGKETRKNLSYLMNKYPGKNVLVIKPIEFQYSHSRKKSGGLANATIVQFPLRLAFASTAHKVQGLTIKKPNLLVIDLRSVREPAQAYVILSRVQTLNQLIILESICEERITSSKTALDELERMTQLAINLKSAERKSIYSCNIRSINKNLSSLLTSQVSKKANVICLQETWLDASTEVEFAWKDFGWTQHNNSVGRGKGISTFYSQRFHWVQDVKRFHYQITKISSPELDIINLYRSDGTDTEQFLEDLFGQVSRKETLIVGDFNLCFKSDILHPIFQALNGFDQLVKYPTHVRGRIIDLAFIKKPNQSAYEVKQISPFFTDHDIIELYSGK